MKTAKAVVHTDVIVDHLLGERTPSYLRLALGKFFCYSTVFQAMQVFALCRTERERRAAIDAMAALKVLGLNARSAMQYGEFLRQWNGSSVWSVLIGGLCRESRLPIITGKPGAFREIPGVTVIPVQMMAGPASAEEILDACRKSKRGGKRGTKRTG